MPAIYVPEGSETLANTTTVDIQNSSAVTWLADGLHYVVAWTSLEGANGAEIRGRVFNADGTPAGADFLVATGLESQSSAHIASLSNGGFVVVWVDSTVGTEGIWGRIYDATLTPGLPILFKGGLPTDVYEPSVSGFATGGGFVVSWTASDGLDTNVQAQVFTAAGLPSGLEVTANTNLAGGQFSSAVAALSNLNGDYVVVWQDSNEVDAPGIRMAIYTQAGALVPGTEQLVNTTTASTQEVPTVTALAGGGFVVAWVDYSLTGGDASGSDIRAQIFDNAGAMVGSELLVNGTASGAQTEARIAALADGGFVISWTSANGADDDIRAQRFDAGGTKLGAESLIPSDPDGNQAESAVSVSPTNGDLVVTWTDYGPTASPTPGDIEQRLFDLHSFPSVDLNGPGTGGIDYSTAYTEDGAAAAVAAAALEIIQDSEHPIVTITITITDAVAGDQLTLAGGLPPGITSSAPGGTTLTLTNSGASADDLELALLQVRYSTTSDNPTLGAGNGDRIISIVANDGPLSSDPAVTTIAITATNDPAAIGGTDTGSVTEDGTLTATGMLSVLDPDTGQSSFQAVTGAAGTYGSLDLDSAGNWTYTLNNAAANVQALGAGAQPIDTITVHSFDNTAHNIVVTVNGANDAPVANDDTLAATEDVPVTYAAADLTTNDTDVDLDSLSVASVSNATGGTAVRNGDGTVTFTPDPDFNGTAGFDYVVSDGNGGTDTGHATVNVAAINDAPVATFAATPMGGETRVNSFVGNPQNDPAVAVLTGGGHVVVWASIQDGSGYGVHAQRYDSTGAPLGAETLVNTETVANQFEPDIAALADGSYVVVWSGNGPGDPVGVFMQRYSAAGVAQDGETLVNSVNAFHQSFPSVTALAGGGYVVVWQSEGQDGSGAGIFGQRFNALGVAQGVEFPVNTVVTGVQQFPSVTGLAGGGFAVTWFSDQEGNGQGAYVRQFDALGVGQGNEVRANTFTANDQSYSSIGALADGGYVVAWASLNQDGSHYSVYAQRYSAAGAPVGVEFRVNTTLPNQQEVPTIAGLADGGFVITWRSFAQDGGDYGVYAQRYNAAGATVGVETLINTTTSGTQLNPDVAALPGSGYVVAWQGNGVGDSDGVFTQLQSTAFFATEQVALSLKGTMSVADVDAGAQNVTISLLVSYGVLHVEVGTSGATIDAGNDSAAVTVTGTLAQINALLNSDATSVVRFTANTDNPPATATLTLAVNDNGHSGAPPLALTDSESATIHIAAVNDPAVLSADTRNLTETNLAADISSSGTLTISDVDSPTTFVAQGGTAGTYGTFAINAAGAWTYTASSAHNEFAVGVTYTDTFSVSSADGTLTSVTINILGTNDAAVLSADVRDLTETNLAADISSSGTLTITDVDSSATFVAQSGTVGTYGTFAIDSAGAWTYTASSAHDEFAVGVTYTDTFSVSSADGTLTSVTINILGTNDAAVLSADVRNLTETNLAADISSSGTLTITDVDSPQTFVAQGGTVGTHGTFAIDSAGAWTYTASSAHNEFAAGVTYTDTFSVSSADGTLTSVTINILGTNDAAVLSADVRDLTETNLAADISSSGTLTASDVDSPATFIAQGGTVGSYGTFAIDTAGAWTYTASSAHNEFAVGVTYTDIFSVSSADGTLTSVTINILGTNDAAVLSADVRNLTETNLAADISSSGTLTITDVDSSATFVAQGGTVGTYGTFAIDTAGAWTYAASSAHNEFVDGVTYTDTFSVSSADGTLTSVTINILGTNDAAVLSADVRDLTETNLAADISSSGTLTASDVDSPATFIAQGGTVGSYGTFAIDTAGAWTYTASSAHNEFAVGVTYTDIFSVSSADGTLTSVTINILGTNDAAVLSADVRNLTETNLAADISSSGTLTASDVDSPATFIAQGGTVGTYGTFAIDSAGAWTYTASSAHNEFVDGVTYTDTFSVSSADGTLTSVTINFLGTNDAAVLSADVRNLTETNLAADISSSGTLTITDVDSSATFVAQGGTVGTYGTFAINSAGAWTYTASSAHNEFAVGVTYTDTFSVSSADGTLTSVTINILGTNDAAVLSADVRNLTETNLAADISSSGTLTITDVDSSATFVAQSGTVGTYGTFAIDSAGAWTYTASSAHNEFAVGVTYTDTFSVSSADGTLTSVTINILGTNDAAVLSADVQDLTETNLAADISSSGTLTITDVDSPQTFVAQGGTVGTHGTFAIDSAGAWTYTASSAHNEFAAGVTYTDTFSVSSADGTLTSVTINILGTNDAPEGVDHALTFTEDVPHVFAATDFTFTDIENDDFFSVTIATLPALGTGIIYYDADGAGSTFSPVAISAGQTFTAADLADGRLTYVPPTNVNGLGSASFTYQVRDDAGTDNNGTDLDTSANTITIDLTAVNDAPTVAIAPPGTTNEHIPLSLKGAISVGDVDSASDTIQVTLSVGYGILTADPTGSGAIVSGSGTNSIAITGTIAQIQAFLGSGGPSTLFYTPHTDNPPTSTTLTVTIDDDGHNGDGGTLTASANQSINIVPINDAPSGFDHDITASENTPRALNPVDFLYTDAEGHGFAAVTIVTLPTQGTLMYDADGPGGPGAPVAVTAGTTFTAAQLVGAKLVYRADPDESGAGYATFTYIVRDNGGTDHGGFDTDPDANTITINVNAFNNGPSVTDLNNDSPTFFEDTPAGVVWLDEGRDAVITDLDNADFNGGSLTVRIVVNKVVTEDELVLITGTNGVTLVAGEVFIDGISIGTYSGGGLGEDLTFTLNSGATPASITRLIHNLSYLNTDTVEPSTGQRLVEFRLLDGDGGSMSAYTTINVVSVDDPATAGADAATTDEASAVTIIVLANDDDIDGPPPSVAAVNGNPISVGTPITLPSGALLTLNADGTFTWDPNHAFDTTPIAGSGASNTPESDEFTYTLAVAGGTASVSVTITGLDTNDFLFGTANADALSGGVGNDFYFVEQALDIVNETPGQGFDVVWTTVSYILAAGTDVEVLSARFWEGMDPLNLTGNEIANTLYGNAGANALDGGGGNDTLFGQDGNDALTGGAGADVMYGGAGDDFYFVDDAADAVIETVGQGYDVVWASASYVLATGTDIEALSARFWESTDALSLTGNAIANTIYGNAGANALDGSGGNDTLFGFGGNDALTGGAGVDAMYGGAGDDFYYVDNALDVALENASEGFDAVWTSVNYTLGAGTDIEILSARLWEGTDPLALTGNELANAVYGNAGANALDGGGGNDTLFGLDGNDSLTGGTGADTMYGGTGDDFYFVDNALDRPIENAGQGYDVVWTLVSYILAGGTQIEALSAASWEAMSALSLTGNELANVIYGNAGANVLDGADGNDTLFGREGNDTLFGGGGADLIYGGAGADSMHGGAGVDVMVGGAGDDFYFVENALDIAAEAASEGYDVVWASVSYTLAADTEIEALSTISWEATTAINLTGNGLDNTLYGNAGANILNGGGGSDTLFGLGGTDTLIGGAGADSFLFNTALGAGNIDTIADFSAPDDTILLDHLIFVGLDTGAIAEGAFTIGTSANDDDDRIIYDPTTGALYYDADGGEGGAAVQFATLQGAPAITFGDFTVI